jgi:hypothetical protein
MPDELLLSVLDLLEELAASQKEMARRLSAFEDALLEPEMDDFVGRFRKHYYGSLRSIQEGVKAEDRLLVPFAHIELTISQLRQKLSHPS